MPPCSSAVSTSRQSVLRGEAVANAGSSCATSASASASDHARAAPSVSSEAVGSGMSSRDGGGCDSRMAVAPGRPRNGCGRSPHPASRPNAANAASPLAEHTAEQRHEDDQQEDEDGDVGHAITAT